MRICPTCWERYDEADPHTCPRDGTATLDVESDEADELEQLAPDDLLGRSIGGYELTERIGRGGMGVVYLGVHPRLGKRVAVKVLLSEAAGSADARARFLEEARTVAALESPHVVAVRDLAELPDGRTYLVMEHLDGESLWTRWRRVRRLPAGEAMGIAAQTLEGLAVTHARQIVHRDIKPANLFITRGPGGGGLVKILDFGIAKLQAAQGAQKLTRAGTVLGTPGYMAPEQASGAATLDARADLYSVGVVLYELLAGRSPFVADDWVELLFLHRTAPPPVIDGLDPAVWAVLGRALAKEPQQRFASAIEMRQALIAAAGAVALEVPAPAPRVGPAALRAVAAGAPSPAPVDAASDTLPASDRLRPAASSGRGAPAGAEHAALIDTVAAASPAARPPDVPATRVARAGARRAWWLAPAVLAAIGGGVLAVRLRQAQPGGVLPAAGADGGLATIVARPAAVSAPAVEVSSTALPPPATPAASSPPAPAAQLPAGVPAPNVTPPVTTPAAAPPVTPAASSAAPAPAASAEPGGASAFVLDGVPDQASFDVIGHVALARNLARKLAPDADLVGLDARDVLPSGVVNLARRGTVDYYLRSPARSHGELCLVWVHVAGQRAEAQLWSRSAGSYHGGCQQPILRPRCRVATLWSQVLAAEAPATRVASLRLFTERGGPLWRLRVDDKDHDTTDDACAQAPEAAAAASPASPASADVSGALPEEAVLAPTPDKKHFALLERIELARSVAKKIVPDPALVAIEVDSLSATDGTVDLDHSNLLYLFRSPGASKRPDRKCLVKVYAWNFQLKAMLDSSPSCDEPVIAPRCPPLAIVNQAFEQGAEKIGKVKVKWQDGAVTWSLWGGSDTLTLRDADCRR